jgi:cytochrome b subunit of formate dehydrogenase
MSQTENQETKFKSPIPILRQLHGYIFGDEKPDNFTQFTFFLNLFFWFIFLLWSVISVLTLSFRHVVEKHKKISIEEIIFNRGKELAFEPSDFLNHLMTTYTVSVILWLAVFVGLVLLWRKNRFFIYFLGGGVILYVSMLIFYMSFTFFVEDTTLFDKIGLLAMLSSSLMYHFLLKKESRDGTMSFFGADEDEK